MRILIVQDSPVWAIGALSKIIEKHNPHLNIRIISVHPKELRQDPENQKAVFEHEVKMFNPDLIHFQYWFLAHELGNLDVCKRVKKILTHHNQKNLLTHDWHHLNCLVCHTEKAKKILEGNGYWNVEVIQHGIDIEKFKYNENYNVKNKRIGYVGRIVPWKNLYEILKAAKELKTKVIMMGRVDKADYWAKCQEFKEQMDIRFNTPDEKQVEVYHEMACYVGNSCDNIEEGTLPLLEAMSCGIPVITTPSGEAKDIIKDGKNGILVEFENYESLKKGIEKFFALKPEEKNKMRDKAWDTVRQMNEQGMARKYEKLYYRTVFGKDLVSVIIPTYNRQDTICKVLDGYKRQTYGPIELIVCDDNSSDKTKEAIFNYAKDNRDIPIKYITTGHDGYNLAEARNRGIFEATGNYIIFSDDRFVPAYDAVERLVNALKPIKERAAIWGDKGAGKRDFIENFFIIRKQHITDAGMFNERINEYGGQSQEIRGRLRHLGFKLQFEPSARVTPIITTHSKVKRRYEIVRSKIKLWRLKN